MKKNRVLILILSILSVFLLCSCKKKTTTTTKKTTIPTSITTNAPTVKPSSNTNTTKPVPTESGDVKSYELYSGNYYDSVTNEMLNDSTALKAELNRIVNNGFTGVDYDTAFNKLVTIDSYDDTKSYNSGTKYLFSDYALNNTTGSTFGPHNYDRGGIKVKLQYDSSGTVVAAKVVMDSTNTGSSAGAGASYGMNATVKNGTTTYGSNDFNQNF